MRSTGLSEVERDTLSNTANVPAAFAEGQGPPLPWAYTLKEAAALLKISKSSLERAIARGEIEALKFGSLTRITSAELRRYVARAPRAQFKAA